ncbi:MAG: PAS domain-containing sensor histidine kinase, partial [Bdellovibrionota bacterium]
VESVQEYAIFMLSPDGHVSTWNTGAQRLKGYSTDEIIGRHFSTFYPECDIRADKPGMELREAKRVGRFEDEGWRIRKDGTRFWANVVLSAVYNKDKKLIGFSKVTRDLSERKKAEDKLRSAYTDLEEKVELRTSELSIAKARAEQAVRARDEFFSIASHELKTPLTSLKLYTQLRRRRFAKGDLSDFAPDKLEHLVKNDERQVERLVFLVDNLLDISRVNSGSLDLSLEPVDLSALTLEVVGRLSAILKQTGNECLVKAESGVAGSWDRHRLEQVLTNLLSNAGKYAPGKPIEVTVGRKGKVAVLKVTDHGPGISAENLELVFQPFKRVKETTEISGLGLGLFITKQIVEGHGGLIHVESMPGEGCTFSVELPFTLD